MAVHQSCKLNKYFIVSSSIYIKQKSRPSVHLSVCLGLSTFHSGRSANSRTTLRIEAGFAPHKALIIYLCQEYQQTLLTAVVCRLQRQEYEGVDKNQLEIFVKNRIVNMQAIQPIHAFINRFSQKTRCGGRMGQRWQRNLITPRSVGSNPETSGVGFFPFWLAFFQ